MTEKIFWIDIYVVCTLLLQDVTVSWAKNLETMKNKKLVGMGIYWQMKWRICETNTDNLTLQVSPPFCRRAATAGAQLPNAAVSPSGLVSVIPSTGGSPSFDTAKYAKTWFASTSPLLSNHGSSIPFWKNTKSAAILAHKFQHAATLRNNVAQRCS